MLLGTKIVGGALQGLPLVALLFEHRDREFVRAAWNGEVAKMRILRIVGARADTSAPGRGPAIVAAGSTGQVEAIRYLLENGADANQRDKFRWTALAGAASGGHMEAVRYLISQGADINVTSWDGSALHLARQNGHLSIAKLLEEQGAVDRSH